MHDIQTLFKWPQFPANAQKQRCNACEQTEDEFTDDNNKVNVCEHTNVSLITMTQNTLKTSLLKQ